MVDPPAGSPVGSPVSTPVDSPFSSPVIWPVGPPFVLPVGPPVGPLVGPPSASPMMEFPSIGSEGRVGFFGNANVRIFLGREDDVEVVKTSRWTLLPSPPNATK